MVNICTNFDVYSTFLSNVMAGDAILHPSKLAPKKPPKIRPKDLTVW